MGWKGTVRSIGSAVRAAERDAIRRQRELDKQQKQYDKMQELEQAKYEVEVYENHIEIIQSLHKECSDSINWQEINSSLEPKNHKKMENAAKVKADGYKPGFFDKIFNRVDKKREEFGKNISRAKEKDDENYKYSISDWKESVELSKLLLAGNGEAKIEAINEFSPFSEITNLGSSLSFFIGNNSTVEATIHIHGDDIIPDEVKSLLKSGRLSVKKMPKGKFNELYQDYVCSCVLRVANELFSVIPDDLAVVTAIDELLNTKTGHLEKSPILSVCVSRSTLGTLNMDSIDPSDSMSNFIHNMSFKKTTGFESVAVARIEPEAIDGV